MEVLLELYGRGECESDADVRESHSTGPHLCGRVYGAGRYLLVRLGRSMERVRLHSVGSGDSTGAAVNAELNCHFFADADVPRLTNSLFLAPDTIAGCVGSYAVPPPDDFAESRTGAAVFSGAC